MLICWFPFLGTYGRICDRSSVALHRRVSVAGGVIDGDFSGNIGVILFNHSDELVTFTRGDRVAQIIISPFVYPVIEEVTDTTNLWGSCVRKERAFGSTGK